MTRRQRQSFREFWPVYGIPFEHGRVIDLPSKLPDVGFQSGMLEIGFGRGEHLLNWAKQHPTHPVLGIEVHKPGLAHVLAEIDRMQMTNLRLMRGDARLILSDHLPPTALFSDVFLLFPDPWPRKSDSHRRLIQEGFLHCLEPRLTPGALFHLASDVAAYAEHVRAIFARSSKWIEVSRPFEPRVVVSNYERKALHAGRTIWDQRYQFQN
ncbi:MAG: tRNA (guanosine(46)-N7)-methyltransferase TrmB [Verrucomicrobiota bacterium]